MVYAPCYIRDTLNIHMRAKQTKAITKFPGTIVHHRDGLALLKRDSTNDMARWSKPASKRRLRYIVQYVACLAVVVYLYYAVVKRSSIEKENGDVSVTSRNDNVREAMARVSVKDTPGVDASAVRQVADDAAYRQTGDVNNEQKKTPSIAKNENVDDSMCWGSWKTDWSAIEQAGKPRIRLDEERFIYPILVNGPNNQLIGLRDTIYLAVRLNRTVIIPHFYKHKTDSSTKKGSLSYIPASQRVDVASIAALVSVVPYSAMQSACDNGFGDLFFTSYTASHASLRRAIEDLSVPAYNEDASRYPKDMDPTFNSRNIRSDKASLLELYDSPGRCALYAFPFRTVGTKENRHSLQKTDNEYFDQGRLNTRRIDPDSLPDADLYSLIVLSTPMAKHVAAIVDDFLDLYELRKVPYISVHWRYDPVDWQNRCRKQDRLLQKGKDFMIEMCKQIQAIEPADVARAIFNRVRMLERSSSIQLDALYFAAPLNMDDFVSEMKSALLDRLEAEGALTPFRVFTQSDLHSHLLKFSSCSGLKENYDDIFSQLEMDICSRSTVFLHSPTSSWSKVVNEVRASKLMGKYDASAFDLTWQVADRRLGS